jgi:NADH-quinone oxidoreductase subunit N
LTGLPPFAGFIGKFFLFAAVLKAGGLLFVILALVAVANSVVSLYYYAKVVKVMFLDTPEPSDKAVAVDGGNITLLLPLTVLTVVFGVYFYPLTHYASESLRFFIK